MNSGHLWLSNQVCLSVCLSVCATLVRCLLSFWWPEEGHVAAVAAEKFLLTCGGIKTSSMGVGVHCIGQHRHCLEICRLIWNCR